MSVYIFPFSVFFQSMEGSIMVIDYMYACALQSAIQQSDSLFMGMSKPHLSLQFNFFNSSGFWFAAWGFPSSNWASKLNYYFIISHNLFSLYSILFFWIRQRSLKFCVFPTLTSAPWLNKICCYGQVNCAGVLLEVDQEYNCGHIVS